MQKNLQRPLKDERDEQIDVRSKYHAYGHDCRQ